MQEVHEEYVRAGAEAIETNTFGANSIKLQAFGIGDKTEQINRQAARIARQAVGEDGYVIGSVGACTRPDQVFTDEYAAEVEAAFAEQIARLTAEGVDAIILETFSNLPELLLGAKVAKAAGAIVIASFTVNQEGVTAVGTPARTMVDGLHACDDVDVIGVNCGTGPAGMYDVLGQVLPRTNKPAVAMPNAGLPRQVAGRMLYLTSPEYFTTYSKYFVEMGVRGVGGCCGTTPDHIRMMSKAIRTLPDVKKYVEIRVHKPPAEHKVNVIPAEKKSRLAAKLHAGQKVTMVELLPPKSVDMSKMLAKVRLCSEAGIDCVNIPDGPRASGGSAR